MSDSDTPDWLPYAQDRLKEVGLDDAAHAIGRLPTVDDRLERAIDQLEIEVKANLMFDMGPNPPGFSDIKKLALIAEHRGETPEAAMARLGPQEGEGWATVAAIREQMQRD